MRVFRIWADVMQTFLVGRLRLDVFDFMAVIVEISTWLAKKAIPARVF